MAIITPFPLEEARRLVGAYGLELESLEALAAGSVNSNFRLMLGDGSYRFLRIYEEQDECGAIGELTLVTELATCGVPTPPPLRRLDTGSWTSTFAGKPVAVFAWTPGTYLRQAEVTRQACFGVGDALGRVHAHSGRVTPLGQGRFQLEDLHRRLSIVEGSGRVELLEGVTQIRQGLAHWGPRRDAKLSVGICHGDLFRDNVLWHADQLTALLDFESASTGPFAFDLAVTMLAWCFSESLEIDLVQAMLAGYERWRPLSEAELEGLTAEAAIACLRFATTRLTDFSLRVGPGQTPRRDYRRFLQRLGAVEQGDLARALARRSVPVAS